MRADRLIAELMLLQVRGKLTARDLSREVEVTERTIYRDIDALCFAGVPVCTERGPGGGIWLEESYRTTLTGLKRSEVRALFMLSNPTALAEMGFDDEARSALLKLSAALPGALREEEQRTRQRFYIDPSGWQTVRGSGSQLAATQKAVWEDQIIRMRYLSILGDYVEPLEAVVEPYGLVSRRGEWHLICRKGGLNRVVRLDRILDVELLADHFSRRPDFNLAAFWNDWLATELAHPRPFHVLALVFPEVLPQLADYLAEEDSLQAQHDTVGDRKHICLSFKNLEQARSHLLGLGRSVEVLEPLALRLSIEDYAHQISNLYQGGELD